MEFLKKHYYKCLLGSGVILSIINAFNCIVCHIEYILLNENQILYIHSTLAQVVGALLGLIFAGYGIVSSKMKERAEKVATAKEIIEELLCDYYHSLICVSALGVLNIIFCLIALAIYKNTADEWASFFMTETMIIFAILLVELVHFISFLDLRKEDELGDRDKDLIDDNYKEEPNKTDGNKYKQSFESFVTNYNLLEKLLKKFVGLVKELNEVEYNSLQIGDALNILFEYGIISREIYSTIDEFRRYRNALVHSTDTDKSVNAAIYQSLKKVYILLKGFYNAIENQEPKEIVECRYALHDYGKKHGYSEIDKNILEYLSDNPEAELKDIAGGVNCTFHFTRNRLNFLRQIGLVYFIKENRHIKWRINFDLLENDVL